MSSKGYYLSFAAEHKMHNKKRLYCLTLALTLLLGAPLSQAANPAKDKGRVSGQIKSEPDSEEAKVLHLLGRATFGPRPGQIERVERQGLENYLSEQLHPESIALPENVRQVESLDAIKLSPSSLFINYGKPAIAMAAKNDNNNTKVDKEKLKILFKESYGKIHDETVQARLVRSAYSPRELEEVMVDFWYNHFNVSMSKGLDHVWIGSYEQAAIRPYAMGKFKDLVNATSHHAAMLFYLDNWQNTAARAADPNAVNFPRKKNNFQGINENFARELMELHTLGVDGGYTQKDVTELARVLTGLGLQKGSGGGPLRPNMEQMRAQRQALRAHRGALLNPGQRRQQVVQEYAPAFSGGINLSEANTRLGYYFDESRHDQGDKIVLGQKISRAGKTSGEQEIDQVIDLLCRHTSTAKHISYKLAQYFVADAPPQTLVDKLSKRYQETDGDIRAMLDTLFHSSEFWDQKYRGAKFKSPYRYVVSSIRATDSQIDNTKPLLGFLKQTGMPLYQCLTPDGYKNTKTAWLNPDNLINRLNFATAIGTGRFPGLVTNIQDPAAIADACTTDLSPKTIQAIKDAPDKLKAPLVLGSPEFMLY